MMDGDWIGMALKVVAPLALVGNFVLAWLILRLKSEFAGHGAVAAHGAQLTDHDTRLTKLEGRIDVVATKDDVHGLSVAVANLNGGVMTATERMNGIEAGNRRVEIALDRIYTHLLADGKAA